MVRIKVTEFIIEPLDVKPAEGETNFCLSLSIFFSITEPGADGVDAETSEYFNIIIGTSTALPNYLQQILNASEKDIVFFPHIAIVNRFEKTLIYRLITEKIESITALNKRHLVASALVFFDWQHQEDLNRMEELFR